MFLHCEKQGGVGLRIRVYDRIMCFVNCHLAAHLEAVTRRNADFNHIYRSMVFSKGQSVYTAAAGIVLYLFLSCSLGFSTYLFWLLYSSGLPWALSLAAGASTSAQALKNNPVRTFYISIYIFLFTISVSSSCCLSLTIVIVLFLCFLEYKHQH